MSSLNLLYSGFESTGIIFYLFVIYHLFIWDFLIVLFKPKEANSWFILVQILPSMSPDWLFIRWPLLHKCNSHACRLSYPFLLLLVRAPFYYIKRICFECFFKYMMLEGVPCCWLSLQSSVWVIASLTPVIALPPLLHIHSVSQKSLNISFPKTFYLENHRLYSLSQILHRKLII